jgi:hypothetical protein
MKKTVLFSVIFVFSCLIAQLFTTKNIFAQSCDSIYYEPCPWNSAGATDCRNQCINNACGTGGSCCNRTDNCCYGDPGCTPGLGGLCTCAGPTPTPTPTPTYDWYITATADYCPTTSLPTDPSTKLCYYVFPPSPLAPPTCDNSLFQTGPHTISVNRNPLTNGGIYVFLDDSSGTTIPGSNNTALQPLGTPPAGVTFGTYFNPYTWIARFSRDVVNGSYTLHFLPNPADCPTPTPTPFCVEEGILNSASEQSCNQKCDTLGGTCGSIGTDINGTNHTYVNSGSAPQRNCFYTTDSQASVGCAVTMNNKIASCNHYPVGTGPFTTMWTYCSCCYTGPIPTPTSTPTPTPTPMNSCNSGVCSGGCCRPNSDGLHWDCVTPHDQNTACSVNAGDACKNCASQGKTCQSGNCVAGVVPTPIPPSTSDPCSPGSLGGGEGRLINPALGSILAYASGVGFFRCFLPSLVALAFVIGITVFFFVLLIGAVQWMTSGGDKAKVEAARSKVVHAIIGLIILLSIFVAISFIQHFFGINIIRIDLGQLQIK